MWRVVFLSIQSHGRIWYSSANWRKADQLQHKCIDMCKNLCVRNGLSSRKASDIYCSTDARHPEIANPSPKYDMICMWLLTLCILYPFKGLPVVALGLGRWYRYAAALESSIDIAWPSKLADIGSRTTRKLRGPTKPTKSSNSRLEGGLMIH